MSPTAQIAEYIASRPTVPDEARAQALRVIVDSFACILSGAGSEVAPPMRAYLAQEEGAGTIPVLGTDLFATPQKAAFLNGTFGAALDYDDLLSPTHPSAVVVAALSSVGAAASGQDFIDAYAIGIEVGGKINAALGKGHSARGFHATATLSGFAAFAALAHLLRLDAGQIGLGLGIVATRAGGMMCQLGTMAKPMHSGFAAQLAVQAVQLVRAGVTVSPVSLEAKRGFFAIYGDETSNPNLIFPALGNPWTLLQPGSTLKKFPSCIAGHRAMAAVLDLRKQGLTVETMASMHVTVAPEALQPLMYSRPTTGLEGKFSMPYAMAVALADDRIGIRTFETAAVTRPEIAAIMDRITAEEDPQQVIEDPVSAALSWGFRGYARVTARTTDGREMIARVDLPPGHPKTPLGWDEIGDKFHDCAASAGFARAPAQGMLDLLMTLSQAEDVRQLLLKMHHEGGDNETESSDRNDVYGGNGAGGRVS